MLEQWQELALAALLGLVFGSFISMFTYRYPRDEPMGRQRSRCPSCSHTLGLPDLIPFFSWAMQSGRCRHCRTPIPARYPLIELSTMVGFILVVGQVGLGWAFMPLAALAGCTVALIATDLEHWIIPDPVHWILIPAGLGYAAMQGELPSRLGGLIAGLLFGLLLHHGYRRLRGREGLGMGDVKFFATAGAWLGLWGLVPYCFLAGLVGIAFAMVWRALTGDKYFPFGPALAMTLFGCALYPELPALFWSVLGQPQP